MPKLCLFDASGYIHRAFHALPLLTTSKGEVVNAVYGFTRMISKVLKEEKPEYVGVCFDTATPTFRHQKFTDYKATRIEMDENLGSQIPVVEELSRAWGLCCLKKEGFEADDLIATLAHLAEKKDFQILILSGDKDLLQIVNERIQVRDEIRKVDYDSAKVKERYGVEPSQLVDLLSLMGDKVDNVPGIPGVGEKTASKLLSEYGSLEGIFANLNGSSLSLKEKIQANREVVFRNRELIALKEDVPLDQELEDLKIQSPNTSVLSSLLGRLEFRGGLYGLEEAALTSNLELNKKRKIYTVLTVQELSLLEERLTGISRLAYDLETNSLNQHECDIVGVSISFKEDEAWYIPIGHRYLNAPQQVPWENVQRLLKRKLEYPEILKCGQNLKFDNTILDRHGVHPQAPFFDSMLAVYCLDPSKPSYGLKNIASDFLGERMTRIEELIGKTQQKSFEDVPVETAAPYAGADAEVVFRLVPLLTEQMKQENVISLFHDLEMPLVEVLQHMESTGIALDQDYLRGVGKKFRHEGQILEKQIYELAGAEFSLNSPKQLSAILFEKLKLNPIKRTKTGYSTDEKVLTRLAQDHPICEKILAYRELAKLSSTYVDSLLSLVSRKTGRIHTSFHQTGTSTGRLSSSEPNLQNIPIRTAYGREIRKAFVAPKESLLVSADYSQIDLRALAHISQDPTLIETFQKGGDVHTTTAALVFHVAPNEVTKEMRRRAKAINFGIVYGQQAYGLSQSLNIPQGEAQDFIDQYFLTYAGVKKWIDQTLGEVRQTGVVSTLAGRKRKITDITSPNSSLRGFAERVAINTPIQGSSADIIKAAMNHLYRKLKSEGWKTLMLVQVHDELLFEVPKTELDKVLPIIKQGMEQAFSLIIPLVVDIKVGPNWNDLEEITPPQ